MEFRRPVVAYALPGVGPDVNEFLSFLEHTDEGCQPHEVIEKLQAHSRVAVIALKVALVVESTDEAFAGLFLGQLINVLADTVKSCPRYEFYLGSLLGLLRLAGSNYNAHGDPLGFHYWWPLKFAQIITRGGAFTTSSQEFNITGENEKEYKEAAHDWLRQHGPDQVVIFLDTKGYIHPQSYGKAVFDLIFYVWLSTLEVKQKADMMKEWLTRKD